MFQVSLKSAGRRPGHTWTLKLPTVYAVYLSLPRMKVHAVGRHARVIRRLASGARLPLQRVRSVRTRTHAF